MNLSALKALHGDCMTLAGEICWNDKGRRQRAAVRRFAFLVCARERVGINDKTIGEWRREFDALHGVAE